MLFATFQFPLGWPSHTHSLSVFLCQIPIPSNWLEQRNLDTACHPVCNCHMYDSGHFVILQYLTSILESALGNIHIDCTSIHRTF